MEQFCALFEAPSTLPLSEIHADMERLEKVSSKKAFLDASFAHVRVRGKAGALVGGTWASDYLEKALDISRAEAFRRIDRGRDLFDPPAGSSDLSDEAADPAGEDGVPDADAPPLFPPGAGSRDDTRSDSQEVSAEKQAIINCELRQLTKHAACERPGIFARDEASEDAHF
ncbi:hypothetical protein [Corynebacterium sanguinis]|uniref:hypothetical protein n=1 Tax=Corynebacterium sanguinis TaxID=2594913 RepID=UPI00223C0E8E|nr:hypothetical protein [Corynebacterium sanguinis]MCT1614529.1 hypothetical protein [Corynebacterium sanguinis]